jgi:5-(carboxyamino)imidazole ribonucleotide mutase
MMGSDSDLPTMRETVAVLRSLDVPTEVRITSSQRTPDETRDYVLDAVERGCGVFVAGAGLAAHLAGAVSAQTIRPVIGVPMDAGPLNGMDALLSTVQMPAGVPVATVAIGKAGAKNAGYLAAQMLALSDEALAAKLSQDRADSAKALLAKNSELDNLE